MFKQEIYGALKSVLTSQYGSATIPTSKLTKEFFDNWNSLKKAKKLFGPRQAQAAVLVKDTLYFHTDQLGSTRLTTRADGSIYQYINYLPFGKILEGLVNGPELLPYAQFKNSYTGQEIDRTTGLYFYQSRFYDPDLGRFIQADTVVPSATDAQSFNRYTYVNNNPFKFTDPTGHFIIGIIIFVITNWVLLAQAAIVSAMILGVSTAIISQATGASMNLSPVDFLQAMLLGFLGPIPGIGAAASVLALIPSMIKAAQGDYVALAMVVVTLAMIGVGMYMAHKSATGGSGATGDSPGASTRNMYASNMETINDAGATYQPPNASAADPTGFSDFLDIPIDWHLTKDADYILGPESELTKTWSQNPWVRGKISESLSRWQPGEWVKDSYGFDFNTLKQYANTSWATNQPGHYIGSYELSIRITPQGLISAQIYNKSDIASATRLIPVAMKEIAFKFGWDINPPWIPNYFGPYTTQRFYWFEHAPLPSTVP